MLATTSHFAPGANLIVLLELVDGGEDEIADVFVADFDLLVNTLDMGIELAGFVFGNCLHPKEVVERPIAIAMNVGSDLEAVIDPRGHGVI